MGEVPVPTTPGSIRAQNWRECSLAARIWGFASHSGVPPSHAGAESIRDGCPRARPQSAHRAADGVGRGVPGANSMGGSVAGRVESSRRRAGPRLPTTWCLLTAGKGLKFDRNRAARGHDNGIYCEITVAAILVLAHRCPVRDRRVRPAPRSEEHRRGGRVGPGRRFDERRPKHPSSRRLHRPVHQSRRAQRCALGTTYPHANHAAVFGQITRAGRRGATTLRKRCVSCRADRPARAREPAAGFCELRKEPRGSSTGAQVVWKLTQRLRGLFISNGVQGARANRCR